MSESDGDRAARNPLVHIQSAAHALARDVGNAWQQTAQRMQSSADGLGRALTRAAQLPAQALQRHVHGMHVQPLLPGCAVRRP
jgi:hypothetical protein